jgi:glyoxylase-like metal-dependent hydrolase (beta-lactamase superfamily II)
VTDVVFTHLHFDHIGWASIGREAYFPNATYRCARPDVEYFLGTDALDEEFFGLVFGAMSAADRLAPVLGRFEPWDGDVTLAPGIDTLGAPGHTPGSAVVVVSSGEHRAMLLGDVVHCPLELTDDEFVFLGDVDPDLARRTRDSCRRLMDDGDVVAAGAHFTDLQFGRLLPGVGRRGWQVAR